MPITPFHLGPNTFLGLIFRKWIDLPVFVAAGLVIDLEVVFIELFLEGQYIARYGHTLVVAGAGGAALAVLMWPLKKPCLRIMEKLSLPYETSLVKMVISGILGAWVHVVVDGFYRTGVGIFWPLEIENPLCLYGRSDVERLCIVLLAAALMLFIITSPSRRRRNKLADGGRKPSRKPGKQQARSTTKK